GFFKRPGGDDTLDARIAVLSRRAQPLVNASDPPPPARTVVVPPPQAVIETPPAAVPEPETELGQNSATAALILTPPPTGATPPDLTPEDRFLLAREELLARLSGELGPERLSILSRGELAKVVDAAVQAHFVRNGAELDPIMRRDLITALIKGLLEPTRTQAADEGGARRAAHRSAVESAKAQTQPLV